jgi:signal peptidase II
MVDTTKPSSSPSSYGRAKTLPTIAFYAIAIAIALLDQWVKAWVRTNIPLGTSVPLWNGVFHFTHAQNDGMAFSALRGQIGLLVTAAVVVMGVILYTFIRQGKRTPALLGFALALPLGGAIGNLIDRVKDHYVTDFLDFRLINFPIFNVADSAITIGICLLALRNLLPAPSEPLSDSITDPPTEPATEPSGLETKNAT